jgi:hypothetical protein
MSFDAKAAALVFSRIGTMAPTASFDREHPEPRRIARHPAATQSAER